MTKDINFYPLRILARVQETKDAVTLYLDVPESLRNTFQYLAGQYLNLRFILDGVEYRRAYSLSTSPKDGKWGITIKLVDEGVISSHILHHCKAGEVIEVMPPDGLFTLKANPEKRRVYYFFAAGSGITPLLSQLRLLLEEEPMSRIHLYYGNRDQESIIFKEWLDEAVRTYTDQLTVDHILSRPFETSVLKSFLGKTKPLWLGERGRIEAKKVAEFLERYPHYNTPSVYHICGPGEMIVAVQQALLSQGISKEQIHTEYFTPVAQDEVTSEATPTDTYTLTAHLRGERIVIPIKERTILHTLEDAGYDPPYSCTNGTCATCMAKVLNGKVRMDQCFALSDQEVAEGYVLTCQSHPLNGDVEVTYDY